MESAESARSADDGPIHLRSVRRRSGRTSSIERDAQRRTCLLSLVVLHFSCIPRSSSSSSSSGCLLRRPLRVRHVPFHPFACPSPPSPAARPLCLPRGHLAYLAPHAHLVQLACAVGPRTTFATAAASFPAPARDLILDARTVAQTQTGLDSREDGRQTGKTPDGMRDRRDRLPGKGARRQRPSRDRGDCPLRLRPNRVNSYLLTAYS